MREAAVQHATPQPANRNHTCPSTWVPCVHDSPPLAPTRPVPQTPVTDFRAPPGCPVAHQSVTVCHLMMTETDGDRKNARDRARLTAYPHRQKRAGNGTDPEFTAHSERTPALLALRLPSRPIQGRQAVQGRLPPALATEASPGPEIEADMRHLFAAPVPCREDPFRQFAD
ncbi:unnamed protein product [Calypogeia fissa]